MVPCLNKTICCSLTDLPPSLPPSLIEDTPYVEGSFHVKLVLSQDFPNSPPRGFFLTKIYHPNVSSTGDICVNTLKKDWTPTTTLVHVLQASIILPLSLPPSLSFFYPSFLFLFMTICGVSHFRTRRWNKIRNVC